MQKLYCYVDESGQDTEGTFFLVSVVITQPEREEIIKLLEAIEVQSKKGRIKWARSSQEKRLAYITAVLHQPMFKGRLYYGVHHDSINYREMTIATAARCITTFAQKPLKAIVIIDGLEKTLYRVYSAAFRRYDVETEKVRGGDENKDALLRLADALCGFTRDAIEGKPKHRSLLTKAIAEGYITNVGIENDGE